MAGCCEYGDEPSGYVNFGEFIDHTLCVSVCTSVNISVVWLERLLDCIEVQIRSHSSLRLPDICLLVMWLSPARSLEPVRRCAWTVYWGSVCLSFASPTSFLD